MLLARTRAGSAALATAAVALALAHTAWPARAQETPRASRALEKTLVSLAERVAPRTAVVYGAIGLGSGAVVDREGTVVTNAHVALAARIAILEFADGRRVVARRRGIDFTKDLAVLVPEHPLDAPVPCFEMGPGRPRTGEWVAAVGYPGGPRGDLRPTFSLGQVIEGPGLAQPIGGILDYSDAIRTDIAIYEGNSGGPLVDLDGRLRGINGAFEPGTGSAFAIPLDVVLERVRTLRHGVVRLPGGIELDERNPAVELLGRQLDPLVRQLVERVRQGFDPNPGEGQVDRETVRDDAAEAREKVVATERAQPRSRALAEGFAEALPRARAHVLRLQGGVLATRVAKGFAVAKASLVPGKSAVPVEGGGRARVVATADENDLALLALEDVPAAELPKDAGSRPAGSIVASVGPEGILGSGVVTVGPRAIPEAVSWRIAGGGTQKQVLDLVKRLRPLGDRIPPVKQLLDLIEGQLETQRALGTGNEPRGYARVLSHDGAMSPRDAGAPLVDLEGRLVAVEVSNANYGTSYAVPVRTVRETFREQLGNEVVPARVGKATLH